MLGAHQQVLLAAMIFVIMLGMGASLRGEDLRAALRARRACLAGMVCQFGLMPALAFGLAVAFALPPPVALALIMVGATPGGTTSNLFAFWARGDVALSVAMTVASTLAAVVMMPLMIGLYAGGAVAGGVTVPYATIAATLALVLVPCGIGVALRARSEAAGEWLERAGSAAGVVLILALIASFVIENGALVRATPAAEIAAAVLLSVAGFAAGLAVARAIGLTPAEGRTVSLETGIQNTPLTIAVIGLSFPVDAVQDRMLLTCALYAVAVVITSAVTTLIYRATAPAAA
ncbi:MAG TPA: bile acid:sodium symporter [Paracoccaceae bacterium]|nr:bile acid:sodium symporter [Paracoccaceae bacterium]